MGLGVKKGEGEGESCGDGGLMILSTALRGLTSSSDAYR